MITPHLRNAAIVAVVSGLAGLLCTSAVLRAWDRAPGQTPAEPATSAPTTSYDTYTIVLIDSYTSEAAVVDGVWLAWVPDDASPVQLVGLPPGPYRRLFSRGLNGVPLVSIQQHIRGKPIGGLVLEQADILELADELGGLMLEGRLRRGTAVLDYYLNPTLDPDTALRNQGAVMQAIVSRIAEKGNRINFDDLLKLPVACSVAREQLALVAARYYPLSTENVLVSPLLDGGEGS